MNEPSATNESQKPIQSFNSFDEIENDQLAYFASLTPEELLTNLKKMVLASYGIKDENELKDMARKIKFGPGL